MNMSKADSFEEDIPVLEEEAWHKNPATKPNNRNRRHLVRLF